MVQLAVWIVATIIVGIAVVYGLFRMVGIVSPRCRCIWDRASLGRDGYRAGLAVRPRLTVQVEASYQGRPRHVGREGARTTAS